jgi:hypothetical protein
LVPYQNVPTSDSFQILVVLPGCMKTAWAGHVARTEKTKNVYRFFVQKPLIKRSFKKSRRRW